MEIVKAAENWAKAEIISAMAFMLFGIAFLLMALLFWQSGSSPLLEALIIPVLAAGALLLSAGLGFYVSNKSRLNSFESSYNADPISFISSEIERTSSTIKTYENVALKVFPVIVIVALALAVLMSGHTLKSISIAVAAFFSAVILLDSRALKRIRIYNQQLELAKEELHH